MFGALREKDVSEESGVEQENAQLNNWITESLGVDQAEPTYDDVPAPVAAPSVNEASKPGAGLFGVNPFSSLASQYKTITQMQAAAPDPQATEFSIFSTALSPGPVQPSVAQPSTAAAQSV